MIASHVKRATLVAMLTPDLLAELHRRESTCGYEIPPWNVCEVFHLPPIRDYYNAPGEHGLLSRWMEKIARQIREKAILQVGYSIQVDGGNLEYLHAFDNVLMSRRGEIDFSVSEDDGDGGRRGTGRLSAIMAAKRRSYDEA